MGENRTIDQQIAVFGQSGSGKTVLLCSFYGTSRDPQFTPEQLFELNAKDSRHNLLMSMFLGMAEDAQAPAPDRFNSKKTVFTLRQKGLKIKEAGAADQVRLTWFDYPGEWFEGGANTESELKDKADTFRNLLGADVALFLVDGQKLHEYEGQEERYLRYLFDGFQASLTDVQDQILVDGKQLQQFPRIWVIALSKADLWPDLTVQQFENMVNKKAANEINALRDKLLEFIDNDEAFAFGKDFLLLSSARFTPGHIDVAQRKGIDVLLPLASVLPIQRHLWWQELKVLPMNLAETLLNNDVVRIVAPIAVGLLKGGKQGQKKAKLAASAFTMMVDQMADLPMESLQKYRDEAVEKRDFLRALVADFTNRLERAEEQVVLVRATS